MTKKQLIEISAKLGKFVPKSWAKTKIESAITEKQKDLLKKIENVISHHERFSKSYFWNSPSSADNRRKMEKNESFSEIIEFNGKKYEHTSHVSVSCKNVYYSGSFFVDGTQKNLRSWRSLERQVRTLEFLI